MAWFGFACTVGGIALNEYMGGFNPYAYGLVSFGAGIAVAKLWGGNR